MFEFGQKSYGSVASRLAQELREAGECRDSPDHLPTHSTYTACHLLNGGRELNLKGGRRKGERRQEGWSGRRRDGVGGRRGGVGKSRGGVRRRRGGVEGGGVEWKEEGWSGREEGWSGREEGWSGRERVEWEGGRVGKKRWEG